LRVTRGERKKQGEKGRREGKRKKKRDVRDRRKLF